MATKIEDGGAAFPHPHMGSGFQPQPGMSLRDWFAASATEQDIASFIPETVGEIASLLVSLGWISRADRERDVLRSYGDKERRELRQWARYQHADAMLKARKRP